jgi:uncharacterized membrane protein HdeD (DUF308 family)
MGADWGESAPCFGISIDCWQIALALGFWRSAARWGPWRPLLPDIVPRINRVTWLGWAIVVLGVLAILAPLMAGKATVILVALFLLLAGLAQLFDALRSQQSTSSRVLTLGLGATATVAAIFMLAHPMLGLRVLTALLVAYLIGEGLWKIAVSLRNRHTLAMCGS